MVQAMINISPEANHILNIVKAKHNLKDKSEAIVKIVMDYGQEIMEPELRPEFVREMNKVLKGKHTKYNSFEKFEKRLSKNA